MRKVYIIGAGPGDPELLTVKAKKLLTEYAEVVVHDRLISAEILNLIPKNVERIFAGKEPELHYMKQEDINIELVNHARAGKKVVRLKGGDPFIFGRGGEEAEYLKENNIDHEIVPGITAAMGGAAEYLIPLTYRGVADGAILITGHNCKDEIPALDYEYLAKTNNTIVIYMGIKNIGIITAKLIESGKNPETPACAVFNATYESSGIIYSTLAVLAQEIKASGRANPAVIYIGDVVKISQRLA